MSCDWSERVALLLDEENAATRAHVGRCPECAALLTELESDRDLLRSMPVPEMRPVRVRDSRKQLLSWIAAAAAAILLGVWQWPRPAAIEPMQIAIRTPAVPDMGLTIPVTASAAAAAKLPKPRRAQETPSLARALEEALPPEVHPPVVAKGKVVIAMQTEDPNVIIVLLGGSDD